MEGVDQKQAAVQTLVQYRESIERRMAALRDDLAAVNRSIQILSTTGQPGLFSKPLSEVGPPEAAQSGWEGFRPQQAVLRLLESNPGRWMKAREIAHDLELRGVTGTHNFANTVAGTVRRLARTGRVEMKKNAKGIAVFRAREAPRETIGGPKGQ